MADENDWVAAIRATVGQSPESISRLSGGANNQVLRIVVEGRPLIAKFYFTHSADPRDRLATEFETLSFLWRAGVRSIPEPVMMNREHNLGIYEYVSGNQIRRGGVRLVDGLQLGEFLKTMRLLSEKPAAEKLPSAAEAVFTVRERFNALFYRLERIQDALTGVAELSDASTFLEKEVRPAVEQAQRFIATKARSLDLDVAEEVGVPNRMLSPGDIGFHNALRLNDGHLLFVDFEYAGWDETAQVLAQTCLAPEIPLPSKDQLPLLRQLMPRLTSDRPMVAARLRLLYPIMALKWSLIMLNDFLTVDAQRRAFAGASTDKPKRQIEKSRLMLEIAQRSTEPCFLDELLADYIKTPC